METHEIILDFIEVYLKLKSQDLIFPSRSASKANKKDNKGTIIRISSKNINSFLVQKSNYLEERVTNKGCQKIPPVGVEVWVRSSGIHVRSVIDSMQDKNFINATNINYNNKEIRDVLHINFKGSPYSRSWKSSEFPIINKYYFMTKNEYLQLNKNHKSILFKLFNKQNNSNSKDIINCILDEINEIEKKLSII